MRERTSVGSLQTQNLGFLCAHFSAFAFVITDIDDGSTNLLLPRDV